MMRFHSVTTGGSARFSRASFTAASPIKRWLPLVKTRLESSKERFGKVAPSNHTATDLKQMHVGISQRQNALGSDRMDCWIDTLKVRTKIQQSHSRSGTSSIGSPSFSYGW